MPCHAMPCHATPRLHEEDENQRGVPVLVLVLVLVLMRDSRITRKTHALLPQPLCCSALVPSIPRLAWPCGR